jgi:hypothetical protein
LQTPEHAPWWLGTGRRSRESIIVMLECVERGACSRKWPSRPVVSFHLRRGGVSARCRDHNGVHMVPNPPKAFEGIDVVHLMSVKRVQESLKELRSVPPLADFLSHANAATRIPMRLKYEN